MVKEIMLNFSHNKKDKYMIFLSLILSVFTSFQAFAMPVDVHGYLRSGVGNNLSGEKQRCFNNPGSEGNEFRLGNECSIYGETSFALEFLDGKATNSSFKVQTTLAYFPNANTQYGDESSQNDVDIVEAFFEAKNIEGIPYTYWVGKRFYRDVDLHMNDFYYFAAMNGVGAGVKDIPLFNGNFSLAYLQETMNTTTNSDQLVKSYLDFRLFNIKTDSIGELNFWGSLANAPKGKIASTNYEHINGSALGFRLRNNLENGFNDFALVYGNKLLSSLSVYGNGEIANGTINSNKYKIRAVEHLTKKINDKLELHSAITLEQRNNGKADSTWWNIGARPVYFLKDNLHFVTEIGHSQVLSSTQTLTLTRLTLAYEITISKSIWARPVIRAFVSETVWNKANRTNFNNKSEGHSLGFQAEAWF
jgi:maltoporin